MITKQALLFVLQVLWTNFWVGRGLCRWADSLTVRIWYIPWLSGGLSEHRMSFFITASQWSWCFY